MVVSNMKVDVSKVEVEAPQAEEAEEADASLGVADLPFNISYTFSSTYKTSNGNIESCIPAQRLLRPSWPLPPLLMPLPLFAEL